MINRIARISPLIAFGSAATLLSIGFGYLGVHYLGVSLAFIRDRS